MADIQEISRVATSAVKCPATPASREGIQITVEIEKLRFGVKKEGSNEEANVQRDECDCDRRCLNLWLHILRISS